MARRPRIESSDFHQSKKVKSQTLTLNAVHKRYLIYNIFLYLLFKKEAKLVKTVALAKFPENFSENLTFIDF